jgi:hypothetical protein
MKKNIILSLLLIGIFIVNCFYSIKAEAVYNSEGAVSYANAWALDRNPNYPSFSADCTNFVSQAMHEGGTLPFDKQNGWYCEKVLWWWDWGTAWSVANDLYKYLTNSQRGTILGKWSPNQQNDVNYNISRGDILFYDWNKDGIYDHAAIVVDYGRDAYRPNIIGDLQNQHTSDYYHAIWHLKPYNTRASSTVITAIRPK